VEYVILTHGGASSSHTDSDGCIAAAEIAREVLVQGGDALAAALAGTAALEDDPRFNAGTGSNLRLDGRTIEMDAAVMASDGRFGAVACIERVKNPILIAAKVMETPHLLLCGPGATGFARQLGFPEHDPATGGARARHERAMSELRGLGDGAFATDAARFQAATARQFWNFEAEPIECDTVGVVVRDGHGRFAATASTGGTTYALRGRVGDVPLLGAGVYAGPLGAVAATGVGEEITRRLLAKTVYEWLTDDVAPVRAAQRALDLFPGVSDIGLLVVGRTGYYVASNRGMASAQLVG
jgi:isoaspartyl peptidase/L-asparaginase-like protein (Ntn-hydrolase superfamily)